ncbi:MAG TPA: carboxylate--amine ligase [Candidatus Rifleibacterium sp.]|nr:carboxylate--amine ligase [Candidatus Rifleibacterium sp.]
MNLLYLSPHFPPNFINFVVGLANCGVRVLGIAEEHPENLDERLKGALADYYRVDHMEDYDQVYRAAAFLIHRHGRVTRVESHNEYWMMHEARLREDFNIVGPDVAQTLKIKRKSEMKKIFRACKAPVVDGEIVESEKTLKAFIKKHGYPVFAKPDVGVGAVAAFKIDNEGDLARFWSEKSQGDYFVEPFIDGELMTFDGIADQNGEIVFSSSLRSTNGAFDLVEYNQDLSFYIVRNIPEDAIEIGSKIVKDFDIRAKFFHLEFLRRRSDAKLFVLEMNCRPPGGYTVDLMNYANDVNVYQEWANVIADNRFYAKFERRYFAAHIARKAGKNYLHATDEIFARFGEKIADHTAVPLVFAEVMGNEAFLVRSPDEQDIFAMIDFIQKTA